MKVLMSFALICFTTAGWAQERLASTMGEVLLRNLQPGQTYKLTSLLKVPLRVTYEGENPMTILIDPVPPGTGEMKEGYEAIPSTGWITLEPGSFEVGGSSVVESNVSITLPDDDSILGKKYAVYLWSRTMGQGKGFSLGLGVKSRLLITVAGERALPSQGEMSSYMDFRLEPGSIQLNAARPGKWVKLRKEIGRNLTVHNMGGRDMEFVVTQVPGSSLDMTPPSGTEWGPDGAEFKVSPVKMKIGAGKSNDLKVSMRIPDEERHYGKRYHYLLRVTPEGTGMTSGILFRVTVNTVPKP